jgi:hypothetical protein
LPSGKASDHVLGGHRFLAHELRRPLRPHDHAAVIVHQIVIIVTEASRGATFGRIGRFRVGRRHLFLLMHGLFGGILLFRFFRKG